MKRSQHPLDPMFQMVEMQLDVLRTTIDRLRAAVSEGEQDSRETAEDTNSGPAQRPAKKAKRRMSPEGRAAIRAALQKRWAAKRAADATAAKKSGPSKNTARSARAGKSAA